MPLCASSDVKKYRQLTRFSWLCLKMHLPPITRDQTRALRIVLLTNGSFLISVISVISGEIAFLGKAAFQRQMGILLDIFFSPEHGSSGARGRDKFRHRPGWSAR